MGKPITLAEVDAAREASRLALEGRRAAEAAVDDVLDPSERFAAEVGAGRARKTAAELQALAEAAVLRWIAQGCRAGPVHCPGCRGGIDKPCDDPQCGDSTWDHYCNAGWEPCEGVKA